VKDMLYQSDVDGRRGKLITKIKEYDMVIKPTTLIKIQGLEKSL
jgi:hypothetical protein